MPHPKGFSIDLIGPFFDLLSYGWQLASLFDSHLITLLSSHNLLDILIHLQLYPMQFFVNLLSFIIIFVSIVVDLDRYVLTNCCLYIYEKELLMP